MTTSRKKRLRDTNQLAKVIVDIATNAGVPASPDSSAPQIGVWPLGLAGQKTMRPELHRCGITPRCGYLRCATCKLMA
jgi:hypothetical protein